MHNRFIHHDGAHAYQHIVSNGASVHYCIMPYRYVIADDGFRFLVGAMNTHAILYVHLIPDADTVHIATHYGVADIKGTRFRRVTLPQGSRRGGLLGQGSILTVTSYPDRTSPVVRGKWILENLLGTPPPSPPPGVPPLKPPSFATKVLSVRERMLDHRRNPPCAGCHAMMDPLGLALENFNALGMWRETERKQAIDASGQLLSGQAFKNVRDLKKILKGDLRRDFDRCLTEKLLTYALGRGIEYYDAPAVRKVVRDTRPDDFRFSSIIQEIVSSTPFQMRRSQ